MEKHATHILTHERKEAGNVVSSRTFHPPHVTFSLRDALHCYCITEDSSSPVFPPKSGKLCHNGNFQWHSCSLCIVHHFVFPLCVIQRAWQRIIQASNVFHPAIDAEGEVKTNEQSGGRARAAAGSQHCWLGPELPWVTASYLGLLASSPSLM